MVTCVLQDQQFWCTKFAHDRENIVDKKRPGQHVVATTDAMIATVDAFVWSDWRVSISDIVWHTNISRDSVHRIVLQFFLVQMLYITCETVSYDRKLVEKIIHR